MAQLHREHLGAVEQRKPPRPGQPEPRDAVLGAHPELRLERGEAPGGDGAVGGGGDGEAGAGHALEGRHDARKLPKVGDVLRRPAWLVVRSSSKRTNT